MNGKYILVISDGAMLNGSLSGIFAIDQTKALQKAGCNVVYASLDMRSIRHMRKWGISVFERDGIKIYNISAPIGRVPSRVKAFFENRCFNILFKRIIKENGYPRIVHAHFGRGKNYLYKMEGKFGIEYIVTEHDTAVESDMISNYEKKNLRRIYTSAAIRIAVSEAFAERLQSLYGLPFNVVYNVLDMSAFGNVEKVEHEGFNFVSVGNLLERKGFVTLLEAFSQIDSNSKLYIIGSGPLEKTLRMTINEKKLDNKVFLLGKKARSEIAEYMSNADCFVLASKKETFGVVYIEAMACGVPVIATRCGGPQSFINDKNGILIDVDDVEGLKDAMIYMTSNVEEFDAEYIRKFCMDNFSDRAFSDGISQLLGESIMNDVKNEI